MTVLTDHSHAIGTFVSAVIAAVAFWTGFPTRPAWIVLGLGLFGAAATIILFPHARDLSAFSAEWLTAPLVLVVVATALHRGRLWLPLLAAAVAGALDALAFALSMGIHVTDPLLLLFPAATMVLAGVLYALCGLGHPAASPSASS